MITKPYFNKLLCASLVSLTSFNGVSGDKTPPTAPDVDINVTNITEMYLASEKPKVLSGNNENIELRSGAISFSEKDINLPVSADLSLIVTRQLSLESASSRNYKAELSNNEKLSGLADWQLSLPRIETNVIAEHGWFAKRCSEAFSFPSISYNSYTLDVGEYWDGIHFTDLNGATSNILRPAPNYADTEAGSLNDVIPNSATLVTTNYGIVECTGSDDSEGFQVTTADGLVYTFDELQYLSHKNIKVDGTKITVTLDKAVMYPSLIKDRFGNTIEYKYHADGRLNYMKGSDGTFLHFHYDEQESSRLISKISVSSSLQSDGTDLMSYVYNYTNNNEYAFLTQSINKGGRSKTYSLGSLFYPQVLTQDAGCFPAISDKQLTGTITDYWGLTTSYTLEHLERKTYEASTFGEHFSEGKCQSMGQKISEFMPVWAITQKVNSGAGINYTWSYEYADIDATKRAKTIVTNPDNSTEELLYDANFRNATYRKLLSHVTKSGNTPLSEESYEYQTIGFLLGRIGGAGTSPVDLPSHLHLSSLELSIVQQKSTKNINGDTFVTESLLFNSYGRPTLQKVAFDGVRSKYVKQTYWQDYTNWILNSPQTYSLSTDNTNFTQVKETEYYPVNHSDYASLPKFEKYYGQWLKEFRSYDDSGNIARVNFNKDRRYIEYSNYKRNIPQTVTLPGRTSGTMQITRVVDIFGRVSSVTDANQVATSYTFDDFDRLQSVTKTNDALYGDWLGTLYEWNDNTKVRTISKCTLSANKTSCDDDAALTVTETYDDYFRLKEATTTDTANATSRTQSFTYNHRSQETFSSYVNSTSSGTTTVYDKLGRVESVSTTGRGSVTKDYLSGNKIKVTDALDNETTTTYLAYAAPTYDVATKIESPENVTTTISVDVFGVVNSITQSGLNALDQAISAVETRKYNDQKQLCYVSRPDIGTTIYGYNTIGEKTWSKSGVSNTGCTTSQPQGATTYGYDYLGSLASVDYSDNSGDVTYVRDNNGNVITLTAGNITQTYNYNNQNQLEDETLEISGQQSLFTDYAYNALLHLSSTTYPGQDGIALTYAPNAFGEPTEARVYGAGETVELDFAHSATYHDNGTLSSFTYGNGIVHTMTLDSASLLPDVLKDQKPGTATATVNLDYSFDNNGNVTQLLDVVNPEWSLNELTYDGLDRLKTTRDSGNKLQSDIEYDSLGNITSYKSVNRNLNYTYNYGTNRLTSVSGVSGKYASIGYDSKGNITNNGQFGLTFNEANQVSSANGFTYQYDGHGRRVYQSDNGGSFSVYNQSGKLIYREKGSDITGNGVSYVYLGSKLIAKYGDTAQVTSQGSSKQHHRPFGEALEETKDDLGYTGHKFDKALGLSYMQARYYDPVIGRFYSNDPVDASSFISQGNIHGFNRYSYANNNPYIFVDPDGRFPINPALNKLAVKASTMIANASTVQVGVAIGARFQFKGPGGEITAGAEISHSVQYSSDESKQGSVTTAEAILLKADSKYVSMTAQGMKYEEFQNAETGDITVTADEGAKLIGELKSGDASINAENKVKASLTLGVLKVQVETDLDKLGKN